MSTQCSSKGSKFIASIHAGQLTTTFNNGARDLTPSSSFPGHVQTCGIHSHRHTYVSINKNICIKCITFIYLFGCAYVCGHFVLQCVCVWQSVNSFLPQCGSNSGHLAWWQVFSPLSHLISIYFLFLLFILGYY